jgi:hypothetical protein
MSLLELNCELISWMAASLGVSTPMIRASALVAAGRRGEHVAALCESVEADSYISPPGAEDYLNEDRAAFDRRRIFVSIHVYEHPVYEQCFAPFLPYASALDLIFNAGPRAGEVMRTGPLKGLEFEYFKDHEPLELSCNVVPSVGIKPRRRKGCQQTDRAGFSKQANSLWRKQ